jgi:protein-S-isoprenylcysteine O-methyltransferase Ste14
MGARFLAKSAGETPSERWLLQDLGEEYARYRREVRAIIPFLL